MTGRRLLYALIGAVSLSMHTHASIDTPRLRRQVVEVEDEGASEHAVVGVDAYGAVQEQPVEFTEDEAEDSVQEGAKGDSEDAGASEDGAASLSVGRPMTTPPKAAQEIGGGGDGSRSHPQRGSEDAEDESIGSIPVGRPGRVHSSGSHTGMLGPDMEYGPDGKPRAAKPSTVPDPSVDTLDHKRNTNGFDLPNGEHVGLDVPSPVRVKHDNM